MLLTVLAVLAVDPKEVMKEGQGPRWPAKILHKSSHSKHRMVILIWKHSYMFNWFIGGQRNFVRNPLHNFVLQNLIDGKEMEIYRLGTRKGFYVATSSCKSVRGC